MSAASRTGDHVAGGVDPLTALAQVINQAGISGGNTHAVARAVRDAGWRHEPDTLNPVVVDAADLRAVLAQRMLHRHKAPGVWDADSGPAAGARCVECAARARLAAAVAGVAGGA